MVRPGRHSLRLRGCTPAAASMPAAEYRMLGYHLGRLFDHVCTSHTRVPHSLSREIRNWVRFRYPIERVDNQVGEELGFGMGENIRCFMQVESFTCKKWHIQLVEMLCPCCSNEYLNDYLASRRTRCFANRDLTHGCGRARAREVGP